MLTCFSVWCVLYTCLPGDFISNETSELTFAAGPRSCAETDVDIRFPFFSCVVVLQAQTAGGDVELCLHLFCRRSFVRRLVTETNRRWISSAGGRWHWELETRWNICLWLAHRRRGRVRLISPPACLTHRVALYRVGGALWSGGSAEGGERHYAGWWTSFTTRCASLKCEHF